MIKSFKKDISIEIGKKRLIN